MKLVKGKEGTMINCIVIDDDQNILDVFCDILDMVKVNVLATGNNGKEAVELYEKYSPDIVFTDLAMPNYGGVYAVENIKDRNLNAKIIVVTANSNDYERHLFELLKIPVIFKPFNLTMLEQAIADLSLTKNIESTVFEIKYKFKEDYDYYTCKVNYDQYRNLKKLPILEECMVVSNNKNTKLQQKEMQKAIDLAVQNDTSHIHKLSEIVMD
jgi:two-component system chemotaxis response regulator CheY